MAHEITEECSTEAYDQSGYSNAETCFRSDTSKEAFTNDQESTDILISCLIRTMGMEPAGEFIFSVVSEGMFASYTFFQKSVLANILEGIEEHSRLPTIQHT